VPTVTVAHTGQLAPSVLASVRRLAVEVFDSFTDADWEHALGGMHVLVHDAGDGENRLVGHGAVVQRRLLQHGHALRAGYVEAVAVAGDRRRQGIASTVMAELERIIRGAYQLGGLRASGAGAALYSSRGWRPWSGSTSVLTPRGIEPTPEWDGAVFVLPGAATLDLDGELTCDWRDGDVW
jgi:aminoglycoside 2'-N-acetyltransferase I